MQDTIRISRLAAARSQLTCAIELWFAGNNPVSAQTLAMTAFHAIRDASIAAGKRDPLSGAVREDYRRKFDAMMKQSPDACRHADHGGMIEFPQSGTDALLLFSILGLQSLETIGNDAEDAFIAWQIHHHPERLTDAYRETAVQDITPSSRLRNIPRQEFLPSFIQAAQTLRYQQVKLRA